ncbi:MAG: pyridoxamine 5'-phosphate oxidase family protein [Rhodospirillaceae bacterium]|jgi:PPOX class probable FMN-dependent enzyme|nr:pyridoxamine 5'-phosphate oxidase family protein [Rhodospirillaceae bacterium]
MSEHHIASREQLRAVYKQPTEGAVKKLLQQLDQHCMDFIARCPFVVLSTSGADGSLDASPKGGEPGFLTVQDASTVLLPDWPGNNRLDSLENILDNPHVGMMLLVPGMDENLRINGRAGLSTDPDLLASLAVKGKSPISVVVVTVEEAYLHCARAVWRADLWNAEKHIKRSDFPTMGQMLADQVPGYDGAAADKVIADTRHKLYALD